MNQMLIIILVIVAQLGWSQPPRSTMDSALKALGSAGDENTKQLIYAEIGKLIPETPDQVHSIYNEAVSLEGKIENPDQHQLLESTEHLTQAIASASHPKFSEEIASLLKIEYASMPKRFIGAQGAKSPVEALRFRMRQARIQSLADVAGKTRNRNALSTLRQMSEHEGAPRYFAVLAIGQIGDPDDIEDFIRRIEANPNSHFSLNSFGPAAIGPILREIDKPSVTDEAKGVLASSLEYMATPNNIPQYQKLLKSPNRIVREMAAKGLARVVMPGDEDAVIELAREHTNMYQLQAFRAMNRIWSDRFVPVLREVILDAPNPIIRAEAARMLGYHKVREAVPELERAKNDREGEVRRAADSALKQFR